MKKEQEILTQICTLREQFDKLIAAHADDEEFCDTVSLALEDNGLVSVEKIKADYNKNPDRLLKIGVVGAVKAGKSSLLNSLFFDGKDILPKAATPMTAALTELSYGEKCEITVDFFTDEDVQALKDKSEAYSRKVKYYEAVRMEALENDWKKEHRNGKVPSEQQREWKEDAEFYAENEILKDISLAGAYQQYESIKKAKVERKTGSLTFSVQSIEDIAGKLETYVGADGDYMPFTSRVSISLPIETLKEISVIDTPGFNDPVPSRDEKARKSLRECDVILILSRAGQFITETDKQVLSKITSKNGIREIYVLPSQIDSELSDMEIVKEACGDLNKAVDMIKETLEKQVVKKLEDINEDHAFDSLLNNVRERVIPVSGICESMYETFDDRESWDSGRKCVLENLSEDYGDYFPESADAVTKSSLKKLGNMAPVDKCIKEVKSRKNDIFEEELSKFGEKYRNAAKGVKNSVAEYLENKQDFFDRQDIETAEKEIAELEKAYNIVAPEIENAFVDAVNDWFSEVRNDCNRMLDMSKSEAKSGVQAAEGSYTHSWTTGWWFWKKYHSEEITTANVSAIKNSIDEFIDFYNDHLPYFLESEVSRLVKVVVSQIQKIWSENVSSGKESPVEFRNKIRSLVSAMDFSYNLAYKGERFSCEDSGRIEGSSAERCLDNARDFINTLCREFKETVVSAAADVKDKCKSYGFSKRLLDGYRKQLEKRLSDLQTPKVAMENLKRMKKELEKIEC